MYLYSSYILFSERTGHHDCPHFIILCLFLILL
nr:MAG TPA: biofilm formation protein [Bacteriophage sp.]